MKLISKTSITNILLSGALVVGQPSITMAGDLALAPPDPVKLDAFAANIEAGLDKRCVGYGYAIFQDGVYKRGGGGGAREYSGEIFGNYPFNELTQKDCHSMSKTITAAAMIKALQSRGLGLDAKIYDYFPKAFQDATPDDIRIREITFEQMLAHESGFADTAKTWGQLLNELQAGLDFNPGDTSDYSNWNYGMCRLLIPYVTQTGFYRAIEGARSPEQLAALTADDYIEYVRDHILKPAGAHATRTRPPADPTSSNFAYLHDFTDADAKGLMPNRRLDIGSGGWAMSAKEYGKFLSALFQGNLLSTKVKVSGSFEDTIDYMQSQNLGMWTTRGSTNERYYRHNGGNSWAAAGNKSVGGQSIWTYFPKNKIAAVIQINSHKNAITAAGIERGQALQEAYDNVYTSPTASATTYPMHVFCGRSHDGWMLSRGINASGRLGAGNMDKKNEARWNQTRFFESAGQPYVFHYQSNHGNGQGRMLVSQVNGDGTFGATVYDSDSWSKGWTHLEVFYKNAKKDTYLLVYNQDQGIIRTYRLGDDGRPTGNAITDVAAQAGFDIVEIVELNGQDHLFRHDSSTGFTHVRSLNNNGSWGEKVYEKTWKKGFTTFEFYRSGNNKLNLLRYNASTGAANILEFPPTVAGLNQTNVVLDQLWSKHWSAMRFFQTEEGTFNFRYSPETGNVRVQKINQFNGSFGDVILESDGKWLRSTPDLGVFSEATNGWDMIEFYDAKGTDSSIISTPIPARVYEDDDTAPLSTPAPSHSRPIHIEPVAATVKQLRGELQLDWQSAPNVFYLVESSIDLKQWTPVEILDTKKGAMSWRHEPGRDATGAPLRSPHEYYRVRTIEDAPVETSPIRDAFVR